jgi:hypothetical protein
MTSDSHEYGTPWYQNFWPWFIVILLGISVIGSLVTVAIAYQHRDIDVRDGTGAEGSYPSDRESRDSGH